MQVSGLHSSGETDNPDTGTAKAVAAPAAPADDTVARDARYELRDDLRPISGLARLKDCGLSVLSGGVVPVIRNGRAGFAGVVTCGSVHVCPCCSTTIRRVRQEELEQVGQFWECQSCGLVMMTLTMRHYERQALAVLAEQQRVAWREGFGHNAGRAWRDAKVTYGIRGFVRAWEVTHGPNGWHCHYHVLLFLARPLSRPRVESLQHLAFEVWSAALEKAGAYLPVETDEHGKPIGVRIDAPDRGESGKLARYLMKGQDGKARWGVAAELTRLDVKTGTGGHRTPFEIARAAVRPDGCAGDIALWQEFERTATGIRSLYWSNGLRKLLAEMGFKLDDRNDAGVAAEEAAAGERLAMIPAATWYRHIARHKGRALALLRAAERLGVTGIRTLIESWGLAWGADVMPAEELAPPAPGVRQTAAEVLRGLERGAMAERAATWRRGFAMAELADTAKAHAETPDTPASRRRAAAVQDAKRAQEQALAAELETRASTELETARAEFLRRRRTLTPRRAADIQAAMARVRARA